MIAPCSLCEVRYVGCHADCEAYKAWKDEIADQKNRSEAEKNTLLNEFRRSEDLRWHKRRRNRK